MFQAAAFPAVIDGGPYMVIEDGRCFAGATMKDEGEKAFETGVQSIGPNAGDVGDVDIDVANRHPYICVSGSGAGLQEE